MTEPSPPFRPFQPGAPSGQDTPHANAPGPEPFPPAAPPNTPKRETRPSATTRRFAVPELSAARQHAESTIVLPEAADEEDVLIENAEKSILAPRRFETRKFERIFVVLLFLLSTLAVLLTNNGVGMSWDEAYYLEASQRTLDWFQAMQADEGRSLFKQNLLENYWDTSTKEPRGHPSITRWLTSLGMALTPDGAAPLFWMRLPIAACFGLTLVVLYLLARHCYGHITAWLAVMAYLFMPRIFGHAHFAVTETPLVFITVLTVYAFLRGLEKPRWAIAAGLCFGLACATKINGLFLPAILLPWAFLFRRRQSLNNLYAMIFLAPLAFAAAWPWMWTQPARHLLEYLAWNIQHSQIGVLYNGQIFGAGRPTPWTYPIVMTAVTLPLGTLLLLVLGIARTLQSPRRHLPLGILLLWAAAVPILVLMRPDGPKYDGVRLFLPAFPFLAILAGLGGAVIVRIFAILDRPRQRLPRSQAALLVLIVLLALNGGSAIVRAAPYYLSFYNSLVRGRQGAVGLMEITYWGDALNRNAAERLNAEIPDGATLMPLAMHERVLEYYQQWGWLKPAIRIVPRENRPADYYLLHYRRGFFGGIETALYKNPALLRLRIGPPEAPMFGLYRATAR